MQLQLQLLLLLLLQLTASAVGEERSDADQILLADVPDISSDDSSDFDQQLELQARSQAGLKELEQLILNEIQHRSLRGLGAVFSAGRTFGKAVDKEEKERRKKAKKKRKKDKKKKKKKDKKPGLFLRLWLRLRKLLPLPALIASIAGILLLVAVLVTICVYCCCCRQSGAAKKRKGAAPLSVKYKDISLGGERPPYGIINYSLEYDLPKSQLIVTVSNCQYLPRGLESLDPYVTVALTDEKDTGKHPKVKTSKVVKNNAHPVFNFGCQFPVKERAKLKDKVVTFEIFDWDYGARHTMVARRVIRLRDLGEELDSILGRNVDYSKKLKQGLEMELKGPGDVCLSLYYAAKDKSLTVTIIECKAVFVGKSRNKPDLDTMPNTYVQMMLRIEGQKKEQVKKTSLVKGTRNPYFNQEFVFPVGTIEQLESSWLRVSIVHKTETLKIKRALGLVEFGSRSDKESLQDLHWKELVRSPNHAVARWHSFITFEELAEKQLAQAKAEEKRQRELMEEEEILRTAAPSKSAGAPSASGSAAK